MNQHAAYQQLRSHLPYLKLAAVAEQLPAALEQAERGKPGYTQFLYDLLDVEVQATEERRLAGRLRFAGFPSTKTLEEFDFAAQPSLDRKLVDELATQRFIEEKANVLLIEGSPSEARSSKTPPSPSRSSTDSSTTPPFYRSTARATACAATAPGCGSSVKDWVSNHQTGNSLRGHARPNPPPRRRAGQRRAWWVPHS